MGFGEQKALRTKTGKWLLLQDNAAQHNKEAVARQGVDTLEHPAKSPDLNPIELCFDVTKLGLDGMRIEAVQAGACAETRRAAALAGLRSVFEQHWQALSPFVVQCTILALPETMARVNAAPHILHRPTVRAFLADCRRRVAAMNL